MLREVRLSFSLSLSLALLLIVFFLLPNVGTVIDPRVVPFQNPIPFLSCSIPLPFGRSRAPVSGMGTSRGEVKRALAPCASVASVPRHPVYWAAAHTVLVAWAPLQLVE